MTTIQWDSVGTRIYEAGVDHGVLYVEGEDGVAWNGLVSIEENTTTSLSDVHFDGKKINTIVTLGDFSGVLRAFTYPEEFMECEGIYEDDNGVYLTEQPLKRFGLCYRTLIGSDAEGLTVGYKLHLLYNLTAVPSTKVRQTLGFDTTPMELTWDLSAIPEEVVGFRPTAHLILDSRKIDKWLMQDIESILYGDESREPTLPPLEAILAFIQKWDRLIIVDNNDGTWTAIAQDPDAIIMLSPTEFQIEADTVVYLDAETYQSSSSDKNEEDI